MQLHELLLEALQIAERTAEQVRSEPAYEQARLSLASHGFLYPLVYSPSSMTVIDGAHRLVAARDLGLKAAPALALSEAEAHLWWAATLLNKERGTTGPTAAHEALDQLANVGQLSGIGNGLGEQRPFVFIEGELTEDRG